MYSSTQNTHNTLVSLDFWEILQQQQQKSFYFILFFSIFYFLNIFGPNILFGATNTF